MIECNRLYRVSSMLEGSYCIWLEATEEEDMFLVHDHGESYYMTLDEIESQFDIIG